MPNTSEKTDEALLEDYAKRGLESAFAELVRRHQAMAFAAAYRISGDRSEAQDILQHALMVLARRAGQLGDVRCLSAWLHRVVTLEARKLRRKSANRRQRETIAYQIHEVSSLKSDFFHEIAPQLDESLNALGDKDLEVLTMHYLEGHSFKSISTSLGGTADAWQKRSVRALGKLAGKLRTRGVTISTGNLGVFLTNSRAEAGVSNSFLKEITQSALNKTIGNATEIVGKTTLLITMKTGIGISLVSGFVLAYGWRTIESSYPTKAKSLGADQLERAAKNNLISISDKRSRGFTLQLVEEAVAEYDQAPKSNDLMESRLRSLMFLVPAESLEDVLNILMATGDQQRFQQVAAALFGRWAELDHVAALARAKEAGEFSYQAERAVMVTWLNQDPDGAMAVILEEKSDKSRIFLTEFLTYQCERAPQEAAVLVDRIAKDWPEVDRPLFELVAKHWSRTDALAAGEWVASSSDEEMKLKLLKSLANDVAKTRGFDGLAIANHIAQKEERERARNDAIYWWGGTSGGGSVRPGQIKPVRDLSKGFPDDWTRENIRTFAEAMMFNYAKDLPHLLEISKDDEQRILIYEGAIKGSAWSNPAMVTEAAEQLPERFAQTVEGKKILENFIKRWSEMDTQAASGWLARQAPGPKTDFLRAVLEKEDVK